MQATRLPAGLDFSPIQVEEWMMRKLALAALLLSFALSAADSDKLRPVSPALRREILAAREKVWRAWFANDKVALEAALPEETLAINAGEEPWQDRAAVLASAREFAGQGAKLLRLKYPRTEIQLYGDVAILYTSYLFEVESQGQRQTSSGRGTEIFVRRKGVWVNSGWHLDSGK